MPLALLLLTASVYAQVGIHEFLNYDDLAYIRDNAHVQRGLDLSNVRWAFTTFDQANWHPLTWLSHMLDTELFGEDAGPRHLVNVALHLASVWLLYSFLAGATASRGRSLAVAALFALHPIAVQPVAWLSQRKDVLAVFFCMLALFGWARYAARPSAARLAAVSAVYAAGLLAKPLLVTFPFLLLLLDFWPLERTRTRDAGGLGRLVLEKAPMFALAAASSVLTIAAQSRGGAVASAEALPFALRLANACLGYASYLGMLLWPSGLAIHHPYPRGLLETGSSQLAVAACAAALLAGTGLALRAATKLPYVPVGWLWYLGTLVPMIGIVQVGSAALADRYAYLPAVGIYIMAVWGSYDLASWLARPRLASLAGAGVAAACALATAFELHHWRDTSSVFERALALTGENAVAHDQLAQVASRAGYPERALAHWREAARIDPRSWEFQSNLAGALRERGDLAGALETYRRADALAPRAAVFHFNYGTSFLQAGRLGDAVSQYQSALELDPDFWRARVALADALALSGNPAGAIPHYTRVLDTEPDAFEAQLGLANALAATRQVDAAIRHYEHALESRPDDPVARNGLGMALFAQGRVADAIAQLEQAVRRAPDAGFARYNLAQALRVAGRRDDAIAVLQALLARTPGDAEARALLDELR